MALDPWTLGREPVWSVVCGPVAWCLPSRSRLGPGRIHSIPLSRGCRHPPPPPCPHPPRSLAARWPPSGRSCVVINQGRARVKGSTSGQAAPCPATGESPSYTSSRHRPHRLLPLPANETIAFFTGCSRLHRATPHLGLCRETRRVLLAGGPWRADGRPAIGDHCILPADWAPHSLSRARAVASVSRRLGDGGRK